MESDWEFTAEQDALLRSMGCELNVTYAETPNNFATITGLSLGRGDSSRICARARALYTQETGLPAWLWRCYLCHLRPETRPMDYTEDEIHTGRASLDAHMMARM